MLSLWLALLRCSEQRLCCLLRNTDLFLSRFQIQSTSIRDDLLCNIPGLQTLLRLNTNTSSHSLSCLHFTLRAVQVIVKRGDLEPELRAVAESEPIVLPAWDPMGALALAQAAKL